MQHTLVYVSLVFLWGALLVVRVGFLLDQEASWTLPQYAGTTATIEGRVADDPDVRDTSVRVTVEVTRINGVRAQGRLLAALPNGTAAAYNDTVAVRGSVELPNAFETQAGRTFDYPSYLRVRGIGAVMPRAALVSRAAGGASVEGALFALKHDFERALERVVPQPQAALLEGILLGERGGLSQTLLNAFVVVGLIHVVVLSGSNISIVAEGTFRLLGFLPRRAVYVAGSGVMTLFVLMTGGGAASVRALIMGAIAIVARFLRRREDALRALIAAAVLMMLWNPLIVLDSGFVLSVLATFGLITVASAIEQHMRVVPAWKKFNLRSLVATTLAVELFILPALLYYQGILSFVSVPVNALVLPLLPVVMFAGFVTGIFSLVSPVLALVPGLVVDLLLRVILWCAQWTAALPFAATTVAPFPLWVAVVVYVPLTAAALGIYSRTRSS